MIRASVHPHAQRMEHWLGAEAVAQMSRNMKDWYGPPIAVAGAPGKVFVHKGGDFSGEYRGPGDVSGIEKAEEMVRRYYKRRFQRAMAHQRGSFSSLSALITAATAGKRVTMAFSKVGTAPTAILGAIDLWTNGNQPSAGSAGAAAAAGTAFTSASPGALGYTNAAVNADTGHFVNAQLTANFVNSLLLYDRLFGVAKTMNSTGTEAVTGVPTRYQSTSAGADNSAAGNFLFPSSPTTLLPATAHNWTVCQYTDQAGNTANSVPSIAGISASALHQVDLLLGNWFMPLAAGDTGVKALTQMQCSALVATGTIDFVIGHPIAIMPVPLVNIVCNIDGVGSAFNLVKIYDNAALAFMELPKPATSATTYNGLISAVSE